MNNNLNLKRKMEFTKETLEQKRNPKELQSFIKKAFEYISSNENLERKARSRNGFFKEFIEEIYPLSIFCNLKYDQKNIKCCPIISNQGYDAIIENQDGSIIEHVELTWPIDGQKSSYKREQMNKIGHTELEIWDYADNAKRMELINIILKIAEKKSIRDYDYSQGSSLVFILNTAPYFGMKTLEHQDEINLLLAKLRQIRFQTSLVYLLLLPIKKLIQV
jgi:hypothetical protein